MIDLTNKTYKELLAAMLDQIPDTYDKRDTSPIPTSLGPAAWALEGFYLALGNVQKQSFIQTATGDSLDLLAIVSNVSRKKATPAVRLGVFNMAVPVGARFSTINGENSVNFTVTAATDNPAQFHLTAETPGSIGNDYTGPILPITNIPGLTSAQITSILIPGENEESDEDFRARIILALQDPPFGGNIASYRELESMDGVGAIQVWPVWNGGGTVKLSVIGSDYLPASSELVETVQNAVDPPPYQGFGTGLAPIGAKVTVVAPDPVSVNVAAMVTLSPNMELGQVEPLISAALESYLGTVRKSWGKSISISPLQYNADVYLSRVTAALISVDGVLNVTDVMLNGTAADLRLTETGQTQQIPVLGTVTING